MSDDIIRRAMGMDEQGPEQENALIPVEAIPEPLDDKVEMDFEYVRENLQELIAQGQDAIQELIMIAKQSQHPRAFEVIATLLKATADINNDLLAAHKKQNDLRPTQAVHTKGVGVTNNNVFVGSTAELQTMIENMNKKNNE
jgi:hypothetical protein